MTAEKIYLALLECWADQHEVELKGVTIEKKDNSNVDGNCNAVTNVSSRSA